MSSRKEMKDYFFSGFWQRSFLVIAVFVSPLIFFTDLTRNPYIFQITLLSISLVLLMGMSILKNNGELKGVKLIGLFLLFCLSFMMSSVFSFFSHPKFFRASMYSEFVRVWLFTFVNVLIPFFLASQQDFSRQDDDAHPKKWLFLFFFWGALWFFFQFLKTENISGSVFGSFFDFYGFLLWVLGFWLAFSNLKGGGVNSLLHMAMAVCLISSAYGVMQYMGIEFIWAKLLTPYGRRAVSTFGNPNFASSYAVMIIPIAIYYLSIASERIARIFYSMVLIFAFAMIFASMTRSSVIGVIVALAFVFSFSQYRKKILSNRVFKTIALILIFVFLLWPDENMKPASLGVAKRFYDGAMATVSKFSLNVKKDEIYPSFHQRLLIWTCGLKMFEERPILGKGWGSFELFYPYYQGPILLSYPNLRDLRTHANNAHNEIIEIISQSGLIGFSLYLLFFLSFFKTFWHFIKSAGENEKKMAIALFASLIGMLADNMLNVTLHFAQPAFLFWWIAGSLNALISSDSKFNWKVLKPFSFIIFAFLIVSGFYYYSQLMREIYYFRGFKEMRKNLYVETIRDLEKAYSYAKREVNTNYELANAYTRIGDYKKAEKYYVESLKANAGYDEIFFNLAVVQAKIGDFSKAESNFKTSLLINPLNKTAYQGLVDIFMKDPGKNAEQALDVLNIGIKLFPYEPAFYGMAGYFALANKDEKTALSYYAAAIEKDPMQPSFYNYLKSRESKLDEKGKKALFLAEKCREIETLLKSDPQKALKESEKAFAYSGNYFLKYLEAKTYFSIGNLDKAESLLLEVTKLRHEFPDALYGLASVYERKGEIKKQIRALNILLSVDPKNMRAVEKLKEAQTKI